MKKFLLALLFIASIGEIEAHYNRKADWLFTEDKIIRGDESIDVEKLNSIIKGKGANWIARENEFTRMTREQRKKLVGITIPEDILYWANKEGYPSISEEARKMQFPDSLNWRNKDGIDWMTSVKAQHSPDTVGCGACWAFATVGQVEALINITEGNPDIDLDLSEQTLVSECCDAGDCGGGYPLEALEYIKDTGIPLESCFPYIERDTTCVPCYDWLYQARKITGYSVITEYTPDETKMKEALLNHPLITCMNVFEDFIGYSGGIYEHISGSYLGGHAIILVGWNDTDSCWTAKNSWTTEWGEEGYFRIKYGECMFGRSTSDAWYKPLFVNAGNDTTINCGDTIELNPIVTGGAPCYADTPPSYVYNWSPGGSLTDSSIENPKAFPCTTTWYKLMVSDLNVSKVDSLKVTVNVGTEENYNPSTDGQIADYRLEVHPSPFTQETHIVFSISYLANDKILNAKCLNAKCCIYDLSGRVMRTFNYLTNQLPNQVVWDGKNDKGNEVPGGIYFVKFKAGRYEKIKKLILVRR